jgi:hypothetical protein
MRETWNGRRISAAKLGRANAQIMDSSQFTRALYISQARLTEQLSFVPIIPLLFNLTLRIQDLWSGVSFTFHILSSDYQISIIPQHQVIKS